MAGRRETEETQRSKHISMREPEPELNFLNPGIMAKAKEQTTKNATNESSDTCKGTEVEDFYQNLRNEGIEFQGDGKRSSIDPAVQAARDTRKRERETTLHSMVRQERIAEWGDPKIKEGESLIQLKKMGMRFIPRYKPKPEKNDAINLFLHEYSPPDPNKPPLVQPSHHRGVDFTNILEPRSTSEGFNLGRFDSLVTLPSTVERKFSNATVRGSMISTHLSEMPSTYSQALIDDPSQTVLTPETQKFNITCESIAQYREKWLLNFLSGTIPKCSFVIRILNTISRNSVELRVLKTDTVNDICHMYMQYDDHPEYYVWKDVHGRILDPEKNLVQNGMVRADEELEFQGYIKRPTILLYFRDGFENDHPLPMNPLHALRRKEPMLCRNY